MMYFAAVLLVVVIDQLTKIWIVNNFSLYASKAIIPGLFNLVYVTNTGAAFSMFADVNSPVRHYGFLGIGFAAVVLLTVVYFKLRDDHKLYPLALGLIAGGALGNVIDRVRSGAVIDFLDFYFGKYHWPAFNVADSAICIGVGIFLVINFIEAKKTEKK